jgi:hypothetical protein
MIVAFVYCHFQLLFGDVDANVAFSFSGSHETKFSFPGLAKIRALGRQATVRVDGK